MQAFLPLDSSQPVQGIIVLPITQQEAYAECSLIQEIANLEWSERQFGHENGALHCSFTGAFDFCQPLTVSGRDASPDFCSDITVSFFADIEMKTILAMFTLCVVQYVEGIRDENSQSRFFNTLPKHRLTGHVFKTTTAGSQLSCAHKCLAHETCKSCNFRTSGVHHKNCELSLQGLLSVTNVPDLAHAEWFYFINAENVSWLHFACFNFFISFYYPF